MNLNHTIIQIKPFIALLRPLNIAITFFTSLVASIISIKWSYETTSIILAALSASLTLAAGNVINDLRDIEGDKINHPERPLPSGKVSVREAYIIYFALVIISLLLSVQVSLIHFLINLSVNALLVLYSYKLKQKPIAGNVLVSFLTALVFVYGGLAVNQFYYSLVPASLAFIINLIRELIKDAEDKEGDIKQGIITFPAKYGYKKTRVLVSSLILILAVSALYPYAAGMYNYFYALVVVAVVDPILIYIVWKINVNDNKDSLKKLSFLLKLNMIFGLLAVYIGR